MDMETNLQDIGLDKKEAKVYLALLQLGQDTAFHIAKKAELKRSTIYVILEQLREMGLVSVVQTKKASLFSPIEPVKLHSIFKEKEAKLYQALPSLEALYNFRPQKPKVEMFEGREGTRAVYYDAIDHLRQGEEVVVFSTLEHVEKLYLTEAFKMWKLEFRRNKSAKARELMNDSPQERDYAKEMEGLGNRYPIRFIPKSLGQTHCDFLIFGNKVALVSPQKEIFATVIEDEQIANSFRLLYEMAWKAGESCA